MEYPRRIFVTGIDTDAGKTYATAWLANRIAAEGDSVITQKFVQTGCRGFSEDVEKHRELMGIPMQPRDLDHTTAPLILSYPASADLAARIDGVELDFSEATRATETLLKEYDHVLIEGAGGLMVPLRGLYLTLDYMRENPMPVAVVTNGVLGSINHTLLTLEALLAAGIPVWAVVYNPFFDKDEIICADTKQYIQSYLQARSPQTRFLLMD